METIYNELCKFFTQEKKEQEIRYGKPSAYKNVNSTSASN